MSTHKHIDKICCVVLVLTLLLSTLFMFGEALGIETAARVIGYENRLFSTDRVHTIDIIIDDWDAFLSTATSEVYSLCSVVIDGEAIKNVGIRGKGNTSLSNVSSMGSSRYSFKIEFDQYDNTKSYHGLDKLSLNNVIQDNTYMKDYLTYQMMNEFGVSAPLCSYAYITVKQTYAYCAVFLPLNIVVIGYLHNPISLAEDYTVRLLFLFKLTLRIKPCLQNGIKNLHTRCALL